MLEPGNEHLKHCNHAFEVMQICPWPLITLTMPYYAILKSGPWHSSWYSHHSSIHQLHWSPIWHDKGNRVATLCQSDPARWHMFKCCRMLLCAHMQTSDIVDWIRTRLPKDMATEGTRNEKLRYGYCNRDCLDHIISMLLCPDGQAWPETQM